MAKYIDELIGVFILTGYFYSVIFDYPTFFLVNVVLAVIYCRVIPRHEVNHANN